MKFKKKKFILFLFFLFILPSEKTFSNQKIKYLLLLGKAIRPYLEFAKGFKTSEPLSEIYILPEEGGAFLFALKKWPSVKIIAVGTPALKYLKEKGINKYPIFYALILTPETAHLYLNEQKKICGFYLLLPPSYTFPHLKNFFEKIWPGPKERYTLLIPYTSPSNEHFLQIARYEALRWNFKILAFIPNSIKDLREKILTYKFDLLYALPDPLYGTEEAIKLIIKTTLLTKRAVCGYNRFFWEQGALISFVFDYYQIGLKAPNFFETEKCQELPAPFKVLINKKVLEFLHKNTKKQKFKNEKN